MDVSARLTLLTRIGFATRGVLYVVIAVLVFRAGRVEDPSGALEYLGGMGGRLLMGVMAAGLFAYGLWRLCDATLDIERHGSGGRAVTERAGAAVSGLVHLLLAWQAVRLIQGAASNGDGAQEGARTVLNLPGGMALVVAGGVGLLAVGLIQAVKAWKASFLRHLEPAMARRAWVRWSGRLGYAARSLIFLVSGVFLIRAGIAADAGQARGMGRALAWLDSPVDMLVAAGLLGFGIFGFVEARYRILHDVPIEGMAHRAMRTAGLRG
jgi:hypothetical protein